MKKFFKKTGALLFFLLLPLPVLMAGQGVVPPGMQSLADNILAIFTSNFIRVILAIFLCGSAVAYAFNKDNEKVKRNCIAIGVSAGILVAATSLIGFIWGAAGG
jgi:hypothetical protein